jgi:hypothetical protein
MAFAQRNTFEDRLAQDEAELEELKKQHSGVVETTEEQSEEDSEAPTSVEEKTFKKRYGDLRRHSQQKQQELENKLTEMQRQLDAATKKEMKLPKTQEEIEEWASKFPEVAKIVETIAIKKAQEQASQYEDRFKEIESMKVDALRQKAEADLMAAHPDFDEIRDQEEFHEWVEAQPSWIQQALYDNETDGKAAARAVDLYKADMGMSKKKKSSSKAAATSVGTRTERSAPDSTDSKGVIYESQVAKMSSYEYEKRADEIAEAMKSGKFVYDMSAGAR